MRGAKFCKIEVNRVVHLFEFATELRRRCLHLEETHGTWSNHSACDAPDAKKAQIQPGTVHECKLMQRDILNLYGT